MSNVTKEGTPERRHSNTARKPSSDRTPGKRRYSESAHHKGKRPRHAGEFFPGGTPQDPLNIATIPLDPTASPPPEPKHHKEKIKLHDMIEVYIPEDSKDPLNLANGLSPPGSHLTSPVSTHSPRKSLQSAETKKPEKEEQVELTEEEKAKAAARKAKKEHFNKRYAYGNFDRYYGNRCMNGQKDPRLGFMKKSWFEKKAVLDIGCNVGFLTLSIAKEFEPRRILGIDIDDKLIGVARKNIRHYCDANTPLAGRFPASFAQQFGPISQLPTTFSTKFPDNVWFQKENFVVDCDELLEMVKPEFDVVLALSITKWIQLNWGDDGLRRFFKRVFKCLNPGGRFILEPQRFESFHKRSNMSDRHKENYKNAQFKPEDYEMYLLEEIGFERVELLGTPEGTSKGFARPIYMYVKSPPDFLKKGKMEEKKKEGECSKESEEQKAESVEAAPEDKE